MDKNKFKCSLKNFINDEYSICREERQYSLFLYNILRKYKDPKKRTDISVKQIFEACGLTDCKIEYVFYEVAFLRDFFMRNRRLALAGDKRLEDVIIQRTFQKDSYRVRSEESFNDKLQRFCQTEYDSPEYVEELNYGHLRKERRERMEIDSGVIRQMCHLMNAKPDLAVIYSCSNMKYLLFIECKFESPEQTYKIDQEEQKSKKEGVLKRVYSDQTSLQGGIAKFMCDELLTDEKIKVSSQMEPESECKSIVVYFTRSNNSLEKSICIKDLIVINDDILR